MNKEFIKKMVKAKRMECEALKEIFPDSMKNRINIFEREAINLLKDIAMEIIKDDFEKKNNSNSNSEDKNVKKINIDFN